MTRAQYLTWLKANDTFSEYKDEVQKTPEEVSAEMAEFEKYYE